MTSYPNLKDTITRSRERGESGETAGLEHGDTSGTETQWFSVFGTVPLCPRVENSLFPIKTHFSAAEKENLAALPPLLRVNQRRIRP